MPETIFAGTTVEYRRSLPDFPASDGWSLALRLPKNSDDEAVAVNVTADGDAFLVTISADETAALTPGTFSWSERVSKAGRVAQTDGGLIVVRADLGDLAAADAEDPDEAQLIAVRAKIKQRIEADASRMSAFSRAIEREQLAELRKLEADLAARIEARRRGGVPRDPIRVAFTRPW